MRFGELGGRGVRIATSSVRAGFAMTGVLQGVRRATGHMGPALRRVTRNLVERGVGDAAPYEWDRGYGLPQPVCARASQ